MPPATTPKTTINRDDRYLRRATGNFTMAYVNRGD